MVSGSLYVPLPPAMYVPDWPRRCARLRLSGALVLLRLQRLLGALRAPEAEVVLLLELLLRVLLRVLSVLAVVMMLLRVLEEDVLLLRVLLRDEELEGAARFPLSKALDVQLYAVSGPGGLLSG
jgi:hypothetical protein